MDESRIVEAITHHFSIPVVTYCSHPKPNTNKTSQKRKNPDKLGMAAIQLAPFFCLSERSNTQTNAKYCIA